MWAWQHMPYGHDVSQFLCAFILSIQVSGEYLSDKQGQVGRDWDTWIDADIARTVVADLIHVQPNPINGRHIV